MEKMRSWQSVIDAILLDTRNNNYIKSLCFNLLIEVESKNLTKQVICKFNDYSDNYPPPNALLKACSDCGIKLQPE